LELTRTIQAEVDEQPVMVTVQAGESSVSLTDPGAGVVDFVLDPDLAWFADLGCDPALLDTAADALVNGLFPGDAAVRMPVIAVTGTNGKTTTSRMIAHILQEAGKSPGLVVTDGIYLSGSLVRRGDIGTYKGHAQVLINKNVDVAVLESHHRGIAIRGFAFYWCDVGVCLNVTHDHIEAKGIASIEEMAEIKRALPERARHAAVLHADDEHCRAMIRHLTAEKICLVSMREDAASLARLVDQRPGCCCVLEEIDGREWLVIHDRDDRLPLLASEDIPASFGGTARFNVSNAMHAALAAYQVGVPAEAIATSLGRFRAGWDTTPWRMNEFTGLPYRLIMDFAHNPDGMRRIAEFADRQEVAGRKILSLAGSHKRSDEINREMARAVAGHFDFYFCKEYEPPENLPRLMAPFMCQILMESGVPETAIEQVTSGRAVTHRMLDACRPGDLFILLIGNADKPLVPGYLEEYIGK
jgi:cyanophycin synthetase